MYKNFLIIASRKDKAGMNICSALSQYPGHNFYLVEDEIIYTKNLDLDRINKYDFIIFASKHKSIDKSKKTLSIHPPGNPKEADYGGKSGKMCKTSSQFIKHAFEILYKNAEDAGLSEYEVTLEGTHHGPLIERPCIFIEIGPSEIEWKDRRAAFIVAKTIKESIQNFKINPYNENAIGIGGPHYCPNFNKIQLKSNIAISHIIPQYNLPLTEETIQEAIDKTEEEIDLAVVDWKGLGNSESRKQVTDILDKMYIRYKKTSEIKKGL